MCSQCVNDVCVHDVRCVCTPCMCSQCMCSNIPLAGASSHLPIMTKVMSMAEVSKNCTHCSLNVH
jgi:hypothetical protein